MPSFSTPESVALPQGGADRLQRLEQTFATIARERMVGVPVLNPALRVQALGFARREPGPMLTGVLLTPWFMSLLRLPLQPQPAGSPGLLPVGHKGERELGGRPLEFIGAHEPGLGCFETCSLFSPMFEFVDQAAGVATGLAVLALLDGEGGRDRPVAPVPSRRGFLFGRAEARP